MGEPTTLAPVTDRSLFSMHPEDWVIQRDSHDELGAYLKYGLRLLLPECYVARDLAVYWVPGQTRLRPSAHSLALRRIRAGHVRIDQGPAVVRRPYSIAVGGVRCHRIPASLSLRHFTAAGVVTVTPGVNEEARGVLIARIVYV